MERFVLYLISAFSIFYLLLYFVIIPILKVISVKISGKQFIFSTSLVKKSNSSLVKSNIYWSLSAILLSLLITFLIIGLLDYLKIIEFHDNGIERNQ